MDAPNGELKDREEFWDTLGSYLLHLPVRTSPILGGDFNARLGLKATAGHVGTSGIGRRNHRPQDRVDSEHGSRLRDTLESAGLCAPLTLLRPPCSGWTWQKPDQNGRSRIDHWAVPKSWMSRITHKGSGPWLNHPLQPATRAVDHLPIRLVKAIPFLWEILPEPKPKPTWG